MMTVRFPNGQAVQYNDANWVYQSEYSADLYKWDDRKDEKSKVLIAQVPNSCLIEFRPACRVYDGLHQDHEKAILAEIESVRKELRKLRLKK